MREQPKDIPRMLTYDEAYGEQDPNHVKPYQADKAARSKYYCHDCKVYLAMPTYLTSRWKPCVNCMRPLERAPISKQSTTKDVKDEPKRLI